MSEALLGPLGREQKPLTVSELTVLIKQTLEGRFTQPVCVVGQISNYKLHSSGHAYFTLKDEHAALSCVMWAPSVRRLRFRPEDGLEVVAVGKVSVYERHGKYQLYVSTMRPVGVGELELRFQQLCEALRRRGWFDQRHKKPLPRYPERIALITSPTGAAVRDLIRVITGRWPAAELIVVPVRVQGARAATEIAAAIQWVNTLQLGDVLIVGRGGGSKEDLWAFNEEPVARAIFYSRIPVISAVGHEVDTTIADLVADQRAATPSNAGEIVVPDWHEVLRQVEHLSRRSSHALLKRLDAAAQRLRAFAQRPVVRRPVDELIRPREQACDELEGRLVNGVRWTVQRAHHRLDTLAHRLALQHPRELIRRCQEACGTLEGRLENGIRWALQHARQRLDAVAHRLAVQHPLELIRRRQEACGTLEGRLENGIRWALQHARQRLDALARRLAVQHPLELIRRRQEACATLEARLQTSMRWTLQRARQRLDAIALRLAPLTPLTLLKQQARRCDELHGRLVRAIQWQLREKEHRLRQAARALDGLSPLRVLGRGYSLTTKADARTIVRSSQDVTPGEEILTRVAQGRFWSRVTRIEADGADALPAVANAGKDEETHERGQDAE